MFKLLRWLWRAFWVGEGFWGLLSPSVQAAIMPIVVAAVIAALGVIQGLNAFYVAIGTLIAAAMASGLRTSLTVHSLHLTPRNKLSVGGITVSSLPDGRSVVSVNLNSAYGAPLDMLCEVLESKIDGDLGASRPTSYSRTKINPNGGMALNGRFYRLEAGKTYSGYVHWRVAYGVNKLRFREDNYARITFINNGSPLINCTYHVCDPAEADLR